MIVGFAGYCTTDCATLSADLTIVGLNLRVGKNFFSLFYELVPSEVKNSLFFTNDHYILEKNYLPLDLNWESNGCWSELGGVECSDSSG